MLIRIFNAVVHAHFALQLVTGAFIVLGIDAYFVLLTREGWQTRPAWLVVAIPLSITLLWLNIAGVALLLTWREIRPEQRQQDGKSVGLADGAPPANNAEPRDRLNG